MEKESTLIKITPDSYKMEHLKPGAEVINLVDIQTPNGEGIISKGSKFNVVRLLNQNKYPGGFVINFEGDEWGFYLGRGAEWWGILEEDEDEDEINIDYLIGGGGNIDIGISEFETIPYNIYRVLSQKQAVGRKELIEKVIILEAPHPSKRRNIRNTIESAIDNLLNKGFLFMLKDMSKILLTPKGKEFFEEESIQNEEEEEIDNSVLIGELKKGKTIIVDNPDVISKLQQNPNLYFLVHNEKGTYDLGAVYDERVKDWVIARKYKQEI